MLIKVRESLYGNNGKNKLNILVNAVIAFVILILAIEICFSINYSGVYIVESSMRPTLTGASSKDVIGGDYVYVNKHATPDYGDIVVVYHGQEGFIIKRAVAFGGDRVMLIEGTLYIKYKGKTEFVPVEEEYVFPEYNDPTLAKNNKFSNDGGYLVPDGHFFLLGDNRNISLDSRDLGSFPLSSLDGVVTEWSLAHKSFCTALYNYFRFKLPSYFGLKK